jgi:hypothetical protein
MKNLPFEMCERCRRSLLQVQNEIRVKANGCPERVLNQKKEPHL